MSEDTYEGTPAYDEGYGDACAITDNLLSTLTEDVRNYHLAYLRILKQYREHMNQCVISRRTASPAAPVAAP